MKTGVVVLDELTWFSALIDHIYQGATNARAWSGIVESLARWMGASKGLLFTPMNDPHLDGFVFPYEITESTLESWASVHMPHDLWRNRAAERGLLQSGVVTLDQDLATIGELMATTWYQDFLGPIDIGRAASGVVFGHGHSGLPMTAISLFRSINEPAYTEQDRARFQLVFPHVSRALGVMMSLRDAEFRVAASQAGLDRLNAGVLLLDAKGEVSFANITAKAILAARDGLSMRAAVAHAQQQLVVHDPETGKALTAAIAMALARYVDVDFFHKTHVIPRPSGAAPYSVQVSALSGLPCFGLSDGPPGAIMFIVEPGREFRLDAQQMQNLYGLTRAEARVAVLLIEGEDLAQLADALGVSVNTVRTQVRKVYEKMGVNSRAAFMRAALSHLAVQVNPN